MGSIFDSLKSQPHEFEAQRPTSDEPFVFSIRGLTQAELLDIDRANPRPKPPILEFRKDETGQIQPVYDYENAGYKHEISQWAARNMGLHIVKAWVMDIPGETTDDQLAEVSQLEGWVFSALWKAIKMITEVSDKDLSLRSFHHKGKTPD